VIERIELRVLVLLLFLLFRKRVGNLARFTIKHHLHARTNYAHDKQQQKCWQRYSFMIRPLIGGDVAGLLVELERLGPMLGGGKMIRHNRLLRPSTVFCWCVDVFVVRMLFAFVVVVVVVVVVMFVCFVVFTAKTMTQLLCTFEMQLATLKKKQCKPPKQQQQQQQHKPERTT
jgi:hypothetical protein